MNAMKHDLEKRKHHEMQEMQQVYQKDSALQQQSLYNQLEVCTAGVVHLLFYNLSISPDEFFLYMTGEG